MAHEGETDIVNNKEANDEHVYRKMAGADHTMNTAGEEKLSNNAVGAATASSRGNSFPDPSGGGSLMELYESRLRRLREYETKVYSRYSAPVPTARSSRVIPSFRVDVQDSKTTPKPADPVPAHCSRQNPNQEPSSDTAHANGLPKVIDLPAETEDIEDLDDITLSTGVNSNPVVDLPTTLSPHQMQQHDRIVEQRIDDNEEEKTDEDYHGSQENSQHLRTSPTESSNECSNEFPDNDKTSAFNESSKQESSVEQPIVVNADGYGHTGAPDSKYGTYSVLVNRNQDDRAVEIALYSAGRPHMRAFHFAWLSFFVAFFTWFAITPLLSEVAISLSLSRTEIWTSSVLAVASSAVTRVMIGPINDIYGARWTMCGTLLFSAIPTGIAGLAIQNAASLYAIRFLIGVAGSAFVTCQFWTTTMFTAEVAGTANSLAAGWGNLGGGVAQIVMGALLFPLLKVLYGGEGYGTANETHEFDRAADLAWRTAMLFPALLCVIMAFVCIRYGDDCPKGNFRKRKNLGLMPVESTKDALRRGCSNWNTWLLFIQYGCCFGIEITMTNAAALYFQEEFGQNTESAAAIASIFGWMNLFARGIGGFCSDISGASRGMRGRLWCQVFFLLAEGALFCLFSTTHSLAAAIVVLAIFSIFVQAAEGSTFAIVPYVDYAVTGSIAGVVGAGGNVGGVVFSMLFRSHANRQAILLIGTMALASSLLTALISIPGHRSLLMGEDAPEVLSRRDTHRGQVGSRPPVDLHIHNTDAVQSVLRTDRPDPNRDTHFDASDPSIRDTHIDTSEPSVASEGV